jgi:hypothetical protein
MVMSQMSSEPNDAASESAPLQPITIQIPLHLIVVGKRLRKLKAVKVIHIADSMSAQGQLQPIIVTPAEDGGYALLPEITGKQLPKNLLGKRFAPKSGKA